MDRGEEENVFVNKMFTLKEENKFEVLHNDSLFSFVSFLAVHIKIAFVDLKVNPIYRL